MKKFICFILLIIPAFSFAQSHMGGIKLGVFDPSATDAGFIIGYEGGWAVDQNFSLGWSADWFHQNYVNQSLVSQLNDYYGINSSLNELRATTNLYAIPLMATATINWPVAPRSYAYVTGGFGIEMLLIYYNDYNNPNNNDFRSAFDFAWQIGCGVAYELGPRSDVLIELAYHYSQPSWNYQGTDPVTGQTTTFQESINMSGLMLRTGFRFYY
ncbi:MAG: outer membrane beta-barrel protein [Ignavibacteriaceae bacterium]|jgi:opacity protein-like surface antigen